MWCLQWQGSMRNVRGKTGGTIELRSRGGREPSPPALRISQGDAPNVGGGRVVRSTPPPLAFSPFSSVQCRCSVVSDSLRPHESQHTRPPCPSPTPGHSLTGLEFSIYCKSRRQLHTAVCKGANSQFMLPGSLL